MSLSKFDHIIALCYCASFFLIHNIGVSEIPQSQKDTHTQIYKLTNTYIRALTIIEDTEVMSSALFSEM